MKYLWRFPSIYFYFFGWRWNWFCRCISVILNAWDWFFGYGLSNWMVILTVQRTVSFECLLIVKRAKLFLSSSIFFLFCCLFWTVLHIFEHLHIFNCKVESLALTARGGSSAFEQCHIFKCKVELFSWTAQGSSRAFEQCHIFKCKVEPLYVILNHASELFSTNF